MDKKKMRKTLYVYIAIILVLIFSSRTIYNFSLPRVTAALPQSGWLVQEFEARAVVEFAETFDIFAKQSGWISDVFVREGDSICENTAILTYMTNISETELANLQFTIERVQNQLAVLNLSRAAIGAGTADASNFDQYLWAIADAETNLRRLQAQQPGETSPDVCRYTRALNDAERDHNRRVTELNQAIAELNALEAGTAFDDYIYLRSISEAAVTLERREIALQEALAALYNAQNYTGPAFDRHAYQNAISTARTAYDRSREDFDTAEEQYYLARQQLYMLFWTGAEQAEIDMAEANINATAGRVTAAGRAMDDARRALNQATEALQRAENTFNANNAEARAREIETARANVTTAENNLADATRAYENAQSALARAQNAAQNAAQDKISAAAQAVASARASLDESAITLERRTLDAQAALADITAENRLADAYLALERAIENYNLAQQSRAIQTDAANRSAALDRQRIDLDIARAKIDLRAAELALTTAQPSNKTSIFAGSGGVVISMDKSPGQFISQGQRIATIGVANNQFVLEISATAAQAGFIEVGSRAIIYMSGPNIPAAVHSIRPMGDNLTIRLVAETDQFSGGKYVRVRFRETSTHQTLVPNQSIFLGAMGQHYVWVLQSRPGTLGTEYFSVRVNVSIYASDDTHSAISRGLDMFRSMPVITSYSRSLTVNGRVGRME